jgi:16S rRNA processing protein RimM
VPDSGRVEVGRVGKPHGLAGAFVVEAASEDPNRFAVGTEVWVDGRSARVVESKRAGGRPVIRLDGRPRRGAALEVARESLPPAAAGEFYVVDLLGLEVVGEDGEVLGRVADVTPGVANDVLELDEGGALPMVEECVREVDVRGGRIVVAKGFASAD